MLLLLRMLAWAAEAHAETPGISLALAAAPPYRCLSNAYVDARRGDDAGPGTRERPWRSLYAAAEGAAHRPRPGECINVLPGLYPLTRPLVLDAGGDANTAGGYVTYRAVVPGAARLQATAGLGDGDLVVLLAPYLVVDGFTLDGNHLTSGHGLDGCQAGHIAHHLIAINNTIHGMGGAGLNTCHADYIRWEHNVVYDTSASNPYQTSGIDVWEPQALDPGSFVRTAADAAPFGIVIAYNVVFDNAEGPGVGGEHTDGNGIIVDTTLGSTSCATCGHPYPGKILLRGNVSYGNGGGGIHLFESSHVTVVRNTVYGNYRDPRNPATARGDLSSGGSQGCTWIDNIAVAVPGAGSLAHNKPIAAYALPGFPEAAVWADNIAFGGPVLSTAASAVDPASNLVGVDPRLADPAHGRFEPLADSPARGKARAGNGSPLPSGIGAY